MHRIVYVFLFCLSVKSVGVFAQTNKATTREFGERDVDLNSGYRNIDTNILRSEIFDAANNLLLFQNLGNFGTPSRSVYFSATRESGFGYAFHPFATYYKFPAQTSYLNTKRPFTDITYGQGKIELIFLKLKHAQNINPRWNVGLDFQRVVSQGFQPRMATSMYNINAFTAYTSKSLRYVLLADVNWNRGVNLENGGIVSDSAYEALEGNTKSVDVRLDDAQTRFRNRSAYLKQYYRWGKSNYTYTEKDTFYSFETRAQLSYTIHGEEDFFIFENKGNADDYLLPNQYYDTTQATYDSAYFGRINNRVQYQYFTHYSLAPKRMFDYDSLRQVIELGATHQLIAVAQQPFSNHFYNILLQTGYFLMDNHNQSPVIKANADVTVSGYNAGDYKLYGLLQTRSKRIQIGMDFTVQLFRPDYVFQEFKSNAFIWENNFSKINTQSISGFIATRKLRNNVKLNLTQTRVYGWTYISETDFRPRQLNEAISIFQARIDKTIQIGKFHLEHQLIYQSSDNKAIPLPEFFAFLRYSYRARFFGISKFQLGIDVFYNTSYLGMGYHPSQRMFYVQGNTKIGNYPIVDPFLVCEIKKASFFVKYEHVNQDRIRTGMYSTPHYPVSQANLRFGLRWRFYD